jgi:hypothetical protein
MSLNLAIRFNHYFKSLSLAIRFSYYFKSLNLVIRFNHYFKSLSLATSCHLGLTIKFNDTKWIFEIKDLKSWTHLMV